MGVKKIVHDIVHDNECLYRRVSANSDWYHRDNGKYIIEPAAFQDRGRQPSVDRASLLGNPNSAKRDSTDGVICIKAGDVRALGVAPGGPVRHSVDVIYAPSPNNKAHALITVKPDFFGDKNAKKNAFKLLRIALARLANKNHPRFILEPR